MGTSLLSIGYELTAGNQQWTEQLLLLDLALAVGPRLNRLSATFPPEAPLAAAPGDPCVLSLDNGERRETVFSGTVQRVSKGMTGLRLSAIDAGGELAAIRPAVTFEQMSSDNAITTLVSDAGAASGNIDAGVELAFYVADPARSCWEHVSRLAGYGGALIGVNGDGQVETIVVGSGAADEALLFGREIIDLDHAERSGGDRRVVVAGESGVGSMSAPEALRPVTDPFSGSRPAGPDASNLFQFEPALRTADGAASAGRHRTRLALSRPNRVVLSAWLQPHLRPGQRLELQSLPDSVATDSCWLESVNHRIGPQGAVTRLQANRDAAGFDALGLLGGLGAALAGAF